MPVFDIRTFFVIFSISNVVVGLFLFAYSLASKYKFPLFNLYIIGKIAIGISLFLFAFRSYIPDFLSLPLANILMLFSLSTEVFAQVSFTANNLKRLVIIFYLPAMVFSIVYLLVLHSPAYVRVGVMSFFIAYFFFVGGIFLLKKSRTPLKIIISVLFVILSLTFLGRMALALHLEEKTQLFSTQLVQMVAYATLFIIPLISTTAFVLQITEADEKKLHMQKLQMKQDNENLRELVKTQDKMFSIIGHDIRSPLATITQFLDLLRTEPFQDTKELKQDLESLQSLAEQTLVLTQNLFEWAKMQISDFPPKTEKSWFCKLVQESGSIYKKQMEEKGIDFQLHCDPACTITTDTIMLKTVLRNLISNAIKFSPADNGMISVSVEDDGETIRCSIADNGVGIEPKRIQNLFVFAENKSTMGTGNEKGTGLGLVLSYEFIVRLGGQMQVSSAVGQGTTFTLQLPKEFVP